MVSKMEKKLRRKLDITKVRKQQMSVKLVNALKFTNFFVDIFSCFQLPVLVIGDKKFLFQISMN